MPPAARPGRARHVAAVNDVSLSVGRGRTLGLVGESGSGKSTLGRCILGLATPDSGSVIFDGTEITGLRGRALRAFRRRVQPVFQDPWGSLDPRWPVGRSVREALDCYRIGTPADRMARVRDLFARVGLDPALASRLPTHLSGGQRQRVAIAAALASEPELIVADEPVSALDMSVQAQILNLFMDLQTRPRRRLRLHHPRPWRRRACQRRHRGDDSRRAGRTGHHRPGHARAPRTTTPEPCWPRSRGFARTPKLKETPHADHQSQRHNPQLPDRR